MTHREFNFHTERGPLHASLAIPETAQGLVVIAQLHPTPLDRVINATLGSRHWGILSMSMLTPQEAHYPDAMHNVPLLTQRLIDGLDLLRRNADTENLPVGLFASAHVAPAAIRAAAQRDQQVRAVVCHGGVVDLAGLQALKLISAPLLMLFDADDPYGRPAFLRATAYLNCVHEARTLAPAENPSSHVAAWFALHLSS